MRTLLYCPVIHMEADLGSLSSGIAGRGISDYGEEFWERHKKTVSGFWDSVARFFSMLPAYGLKVFQDGMVADGETGLKIVLEGVDGGSKNFEVVNDLIERGAVLVRTEDIALVKEEMAHFVRILRAGTLPEKTAACLRYKAVKKGLLKRRDRFMAQRIAEAVGPGETGALFVGAYHDVAAFLPGDIRAVFLKDIGSVREYQRLIPGRERKKERFDRLSAYLISPITVVLPS